MARNLKDLKSLGDGSFERMIQEEREAANGDEEKAMNSLTARVLESFIIKQVGRGGEDRTRVGILPERVRILIEKLNGTNIILVAEKQITSTDLNEKENRLLLAEKKILNEFVTPEEEHELNEKRGVKVTVIQPCLETTPNLQLKKWAMKENFYFALIGNWSSIANNKKNRLRKNCMIRLFSFRKESSLYFALVRA
ncbi:hypothetical protein ACOSQ2_011648 [Xanthoceras sorbifolium]